MEINIMPDKILDITSWDELPDEIGLALRDMKAGESISFTVADDDNPAVAREYRLTLSETILVREEEYEHLKNTNTCDSDMGPIGYPW